MICDGKPGWPPRARQTMPKEQSASPASTYPTFHKTGQGFKLSHSQANISQHSKPDPQKDATRLVFPCSCMQRAPAGAVLHSEMLRRRTFQEHPTAFQAWPISSVDSCECPWYILAPRLHGARRKGLAFVSRVRLWGTLQIATGMKRLSLIVNARL